MYVLILIKNFITHVYAYFVLVCMCTYNILYQCTCIRQYIYAYLFEFNADLDPELPSSSNTKKRKIQDEVDGEDLCVCIVIYYTKSP